MTILIIEDFVTKHSHSQPRCYETKWGSIIIIKHAGHPIHGNRKHLSFKLKSAAKCLNRVVLLLTKTKKRLFVFKKTLNMRCYRGKFKSDHYFVFVSMNFITITGKNAWFYISNSKWILISCLLCTLYTPFPTISCKYLHYSNHWEWMVLYSIVDKN